MFLGLQVDGMQNEAINLRRAGDVLEILVLDGADIGARNMVLALGIFCPT